MPLDKEVHGNISAYGTGISSKLNGKMDEAHGNTWILPTAKRVWSTLPYSASAAFRESRIQMKQHTNKQNKEQQAKVIKSHAKHTAEVI